MQFLSENAPMADMSRCFGSHKRFHFLPVFHKLQVDIDKYILTNNIFVFILNETTS